MTFDEIWNTLVAKNDRLNEPNATVEFRSENLKKLLRQVYYKGFDQSKRASEVMDKLFGGLGRK